MEDQLRESTSRPTMGSAEPRAPRARFYPTDLHVSFACCPFISPPVSTGTLEINTDGRSHPARDVLSDPLLAAVLSTVGSRLGRPSLRARSSPPLGPNGCGTSCPEPCTSEREDIPSARERLGYADARDAPGARPELTVRGTSVPASSGPAFCLRAHTDASRPRD